MSHRWDNMNYITHPQINTLKGRYAAAFGGFIIFLIKCLKSVMLYWFLAIIPLQRELNRNVVTLL